MGRTYEALRRAEEERRKKTAPADEGATVPDPVEPSLPAPAERNWFRFRRRSTGRPEGGPNGSAHGNGYSAGRTSAAAGNPLAHANSPTTIEEYQQLRKNLLAARTTRPLQLILLVASRHGEGATTTSTMLGWAMANGGRCLLIDANFRTPGLSRIFNGTEAPGLCEALADDPEQRRIHYLPTEIPNLYFMPTGRGPARVPYIFEGQKFDDLVSTLRREFDCILIDGAPMEMYADSSYIAPKTDGVIIVVRAESTPLGSPSISLRELERVGAPVLGAVLNCTQTYIPRILQRLSNPQEVLEIAVLPSSSTQVQK
ncbi:MAG: hypothetical protein RL698_452 [Pseudomonadota bacterium]